MRANNVDVLTVGQYLRPSLRHLPVERHVTPEEFEDLKVVARRMGFRHVESGPLVRSSYHAHAQLQ
jgi:lipoic acid synthetase